MSPAVDTEELAARLPAVLRPVLGEVTVGDLRLLTGGASRATWAFDVAGPGGRRDLILQTGRSADGRAGMAQQARVQAAAAAHGARVPEILAADDDPRALGEPFLVCAAVPGETVVRRIERRLDEAGPAGRARLLTQCAQSLAAIHRSDPDGLGLRAEDQLAQCRRELAETGETTAVFECAFRWLAAHRPEPDPATARSLVHGDFRMGNLIVDDQDGGGGLAAVLDWELTHLGDPCEDLAWFCVRAWRFGAPGTRAAGGLGSVDELLAAYRAAGGLPVEPGRLRWWLVLGTLRWGIICCYQAHRHLSGQTRSVELATIGRRVAETEWDLLGLLGLLDDDRPAAAPDVTRSDAASPVGLFGRPSAAELIAAVAEFLDERVRPATAGAANGLSFHSRVAANALRIVERELRGSAGEQIRRALARTGFIEEAGLAAAVRAGDVDAADPAIADCLTAVVRAKLSVNHPGYDAE